MGLLDFLRPSSDGRAPRQVPATVPGRTVARRHSGIVLVAYRGPDQYLPASIGSGYAFKWALKEAPVVGMRVKVPGADGMSPGVIVGFGIDAPDPGVELKTVRDIIPGPLARLEPTDAELDTAAIFDALTLLKLPPPYDRDPQALPTDLRRATTRAKNVDEKQMARRWWRTYKTAEARGLPHELVTALKAEGDAWYARLRTSNRADQHTADNTDPEAT